MSVLLVIVAILLGLIGLVGSIVPVLPGPPVGWVGLLLFSFTRFYGQPEWFLWVWLGVVILVTLADNLLPLWMTKKFGGSKAATIGTGIGMLVGMFAGPWGMIAGPFAGAFIGELIANGRRREEESPYEAEKRKVYGANGDGRGEPRGREVGEALRVATGAFVAFISGVGVKLIASGMMLYYMVKDLVV